MDKLTSDLLEGRISAYQANIAVVGLGYVGLPLAVAFGKQYRTVGFDISPDRINALRKQVDPTGETSAKELQEASYLSFTIDAMDMQGCNVFIVAVPTPVDNHNIPDLSPLISASRLIGRVMRPGALVIYESTVFPGCTEDDCVPVLEKESGLEFNQDFYVGYSPERINPGDKNHTLFNVVKIVSGSSPEALEAVSLLYGKVVQAGVCKASSIRVAEAAKVIENAQRDINIAFVNELSMIFRKMGIDTHEVLDAAATKWNFLNFRPGLVGGHCFTYDHLVTIKRGLQVRTQKIGDYITGGYLDGDRILSFDASARKLSFQNILGCSASIYNKVITVTTERNHSISVTDKHPLLVYEGGKLLERHADEIAVGDKIPLFCGIGLPIHTQVHDSVDLIGHIPEDMVAKVRVVPKTGSWVSHKLVMGLRKTKGFNPWNFYIGNYLPLKVFLELEKSGNMPVARKDVYLKTGRGPSSNKITAAVNVDEDLARLVGYYLSEGCVTIDKTTRTRFSFNEDEKQFINDVKSVAAKLGMSFSEWHNRKDHCIHVKLSSEIFGILIENILQCGKNCYEKSIPSVMLYNPKLVLPVLSGILRGDGSLGKVTRSTGNSCTMTFSSSSKIMLNQICYALLSSGIPYSHYISPVHPKVNHLTILGGQDVLSKISPLLGTEDSDKIACHLNTCKRKPSLNYEFAEGLWLVPVKTTSTDNREQHVFSIEVENTKTIITNFGIIAHNCIGVDPYYLAHKAQEYGYHPEVILAGRRLNDNMGVHVAQEVVKLMILKGHQVKGATVMVLGCTFKENCSDARNSRVFDIIKELQSFGCLVQVVDPRADHDFVHQHYGVRLNTDSTTDDVAAVIVAVAHDEFKTLDFGTADLRKLVVYDVKGILPAFMTDGRL